jgi:phospholipase C
MAAWPRRRLRSATGDLTSAFNFVAPDFSIPSLPAAEPSDPAGHPECIQQQPYPSPAQRMPSQEAGRGRPVRSRRPDGAACPQTRDCLIPSGGGEPLVNLVDRHRALADG